VVDKRATVRGGVQAAKMVVVVWEEAVTVVIARPATLPRHPWVAAGAEPTTKVAVAGPRREEEDAGGVANTPPAATDEKRAGETEAAAERAAVSAEATMVDDDVCGWRVGSHSALSHGRVARAGVVLLCREERERCEFFERRVRAFASVKRQRRASHPHAHPMVVGLAAGKATGGRKRRG